MDDSMSSDLLIYHTSDSILGHISISIEIYRSSWSRMIIPTYEIHAEMMICLLSYHDPPVEPLWSHPVKPTFFDIWLSSCFSFWGTPFWFVGLIQLWTWITRIAHSMMDDLISSGFPYYHTFDAILGHTFVLVKICRSSLICMIVLSHEIHIGPMVCFHFVLILQWSISQVIKLGSYFLILSWFLDGVISGA